MDVTTTIKYVRISPTKLNRVIKEIVGKNVSDALIILKFLPQKGAELIYKALHSAKSNAVNNYQMTEQELVVKEGYIGQALIMKRFRPMSKGRSGKIQKKLSHITITLNEGSSHGAKN
ncbi:MAG: 50S ribosomal protein L22 [Candidatus Margulisbacteria bacterium GWF2_35_9]|nr:ribosomal protein L22 [uncultured bacterium]OGI07012.1 MAG: 50S ribosomal protein L22 [Candidatus Margulisbacteria bacterium GWF2_35_9]